MAHGSVVVFLHVILLAAANAQSTQPNDSKGLAFKSDEAAALQALHQQLTLCGATVDGVVAADPCATEWIACTANALPLNPPNLTAGTFAIVLPNSNLRCSIAQLATPLQSLPQLSQLNISYNQLSGTLPTVWTRITNLESLAVAGNNITGPIPGQYSLLNKLAVLDLASNRLTGPLPLPFSSLVSLKSMILSNNNLGSGAFGELPPEWSELTQLETFHLSNNRIGGAIPEAYGAMASLRSLRFDGNELFGALVGSLSGAVNLRELHFQNNNIQGNVPLEWGRLKALQELLLYNNSLIFTLPPEWSSMASLRVLRADDNFIADKLPSGWWAMSSLTHLDLSYNNITGALPPAWSKFPNLSVLRLRSNQLNGTLPLLWAAFPKLVDLDLANNGFAGGLPAEWNKVSTLASLDVSSNGISQALPSSWSSLQLTSLNLSNNLLTQQLPSSWASMGALLSLDLETNRLTGPLPIAWGSFSGGLKVLHLRGNNLSNGSDDQMIPRQWYAPSWLEAAEAEGPPRLWGTLNSLSLASWRLSISDSNLTLSDILSQAPAVTSAGLAAPNCSAPSPAPSSTPPVPSLAFITITSAQANVEFSGWQFARCTRPVLSLAVKSFSLVNITAISNQGPVIDLLAGAGSIVASVFSGNTARVGAAISVRSGACLQLLERSQFTGNSGRLVGGAVFLGSKDTVVGSSCSTTMQQVVFRNNSVGGNGGAVFTAAPDLQLLQSNFEGNSASGEGGAVAMLSTSNVSINVCTLINNTAQFGGAVAVIPAPTRLFLPSSPLQGILVLNDTDKRGNTGRPAGGGIGGDMVYAVNMSRVWLTGCAFARSQPVLVADGLAVTMDSLLVDELTACLSGNATTPPTSALASGIPTTLTPATNISSSVFCNTTFNLHLHALDGLNQTITAIPPDSILLARLYPSDSTTSIIGSASAVLNNGTLTFYDLSICSLSATTVQINIVPVYVTRNADSIQLNNFTFQLQTLGCPAGAVTQPTGCAFCPKGSFSFNSEKRVCDTCPSGAWCEGSTVLPLPNYWHSHPRSPAVHRCLVPHVCNTRRDAYQQLVTLQQQYQQYTRASNSTSPTAALNTLNITRSSIPGAGQSANAGLDMAPTAAAGILSAADVQVLLQQLEKKYWEVQCAEGYQGVLCGSCVPGYGPNEWSECVRCDTEEWQVWAAFAASFLPNALLVGGGCVLLVMASTMEDDGIIPETAAASEQQDSDSRMDALAVMMLVATHVQLMSLLPVVQSPWTPAVRRMFYSLGQLIAVSGGFGPPLQCGVLTAASTFPRSMIVKVINIFTPAMALILVLLTTATFQLILRTRGNSALPPPSSSSPTTLCSCILLTLVFYYVELSSTFMSMMNCREVDRSSFSGGQYRSYLDAVGWHWVPDTGWKCGAVNWGVGIPGTVLFVLATPLLSLAAHRTQPDTVRWAALLNPLYALLQFPYQNPNSKDAIILFFTKALAVAAITYPTATATQLAALTIALLVYLVQLLWRWPHRTPLVNHASAVSLCVHTASVLLLQVSNVTADDSPFQTTIYTVLALVHITVLLALSALIIICLMGVGTLHKSHFFASWPPLKSAVQRFSASFTSTGSPPTGPLSTPPNTGRPGTDSTSVAASNTPHEPGIGPSEGGTPERPVRIDSLQMAAGGGLGGAGPSRKWGHGSGSTSQVGLLAEERASMGQAAASASNEELEQRVFKPKARFMPRGRAPGSNWGRKQSVRSVLKSDAKMPKDQQSRELEAVKNPSDYEPVSDSAAGGGEYELAVLTPSATFAPGLRPARVQILEPDMAVFTQVPSPSALGKRKSENQEVEPAVPSIGDVSPGPHVDDDLHDTMGSTMLKWPETIFGAGGSESRLLAMTPVDGDPSASTGSRKRREPQGADWGPAGAALREQGQLVLKARAPTRAGKTTEKLQETKSEP